MQFFSLASVWFGAALPAILAMYILRRKYINTEVPSHLLWNQVLRNIEANRPWQRLRGNVPLYLQLAAAVLLVLALMEPWVWAARSASSHQVLIIDQSASMAAKPVKLTQDMMINTDSRPQTRLEAAKRLASEWVQGEAAGSEITLIAMGKEPRLLSERSTDREQLLSALDALQPQYGETAYQETLSMADALSRGDSEAEIRIFTDAQWPEEEAVSQIQAPVRIHLTDTEKGNNFAAAQFGVQADTKAAADSSSGVTATAVVRNDGRTLQEAEAVLRIDGKVHEVRKLRLGAEKQAALRYSGLPEGAYYELQVTAKLDDYAADNALYAFIDEQRPVRVLLLTEGNLFLEKALQLAGAEVVKMRVDNQNVPQPPVTSEELIIIDKTNTKLLVSNEWKTRLATRPVWYIQSGLEAAEAIVSSKGYRIVDHPVTSYLRLSDTHISKHWDVDSTGWGEAIVYAGEQPLMFAGEENGQPRLLFTFDLQQTDLALRTEFPILVNNALEWLVRSRTQALGRLTALQPADGAGRAFTEAARWVPVYSSSQHSLASSGGEKEAAGSILAPALPGLYILEDRMEQGAVRQAYAEVVPSLKEAHIYDRIDAAELKKAMKGQGGLGSPGKAFSHTGTELEAAEEAGRSPYPLTMWISLVVLLAILAEWEVNRRGYSI